MKNIARILALPVASTLKRVGKDHLISETISREHLWEAVREFQRRDRRFGAVDT